MDTTPLPGFITRKQASERCERAERTLQRYWSRAIELKNYSVLENLKLRTEDGEIIEGQDVTKAKIDGLKKKGKNPTWYVRATWVERAYGPRLEVKDEKKRSPSEKKSLVMESRGVESPARHESNLMAVLQQQISDLRADKERLEREKQQEKEYHREDFKMLKEMFDTLKEDHEGTKKLLGKALDVGVEKLRQGDDSDRSTEAHAVRRKPTRTQRDEKTVVDVDPHPQSFLDRHLPTLSRPFRRR